MLHSLKAKFTLAFGTLIVLLFASLGFFLVNAKIEELSIDIASGVQSFAHFTGEEIVELSETSLEQGDFVAFSRDLQRILDKNENIAAAQVATYSGVILYDSAQEQQERYFGVLRTTDEATLKRLQSTRLSLLLENGRILYVKPDSGTAYVNFNEESVEAPSLFDRIENILLPVDGEYGVIYDVSYVQMDERLQEARRQIVLLAGVGLLLTLMISFMLSVSITQPLKELETGALKIAGGDFSARVRVRTRDELGVLAGTFNQMAADLATSIEAKMYQERVTKELELAAKIQIDLLPKQKLELPHLEVVGGLNPATEIGGDAFDFIQMENGHHLIYLGDGTGHGVPAGLMSSISNALLYAFRGETDLKVIAKHMNTVIQKKSSNTMFITMGLTVWDEENRTLRYMNAGHLPLIYFDATSHKLSEIKLSGMAFGMVDDIVPYLHEQNISLKPGDAAILYSDGIPDAQNEKGEAYGVIRLKRSIQDAANEGLSAEQIRDAILKDVLIFMGQREHLDDITVVVMKARGGVSQP